MKICDSQEKNEDGSSRQKILADIYRKTPPFDKSLDIELSGLDNGSGFNVPVFVNGACIGVVDEKMAKFLKENHDRVLGLFDFKITWESPLEEALEEELDNSVAELPENFDWYKYREKKIKDKDRIYSAKFKIKVQSKE